MMEKTNPIGSTRPPGNREVMGKNPSIGSKALKLKTTAPNQTMYDQIVQKWWLSTHITLIKSLRENKKIEK